MKNLLSFFKVVFRLSKLDRNVVSGVKNSISFKNFLTNEIHWRSYFTPCIFASIHKSWILR